MAEFRNSPQETFQHSIRVLLVEDSASILCQLRQLLREKFPGSHLDAATNVACAQVHVQAAIDAGRAYDVVILDSNLPAVD